MSIRILDNAKVLVTGGSGYIGGVLAKVLRDDLFVHVDTPSYRFPDEVDKFDTDYTHVFHLASTVHSYNVLDDEDWDLDTRVNTLGTQRLLHHLKDTKPRFTYVSTFFVNSGEPRCTYAASKLAAEHFCLAYNRIFDMQNSVVRLPNVFGPGEYGSKRKGAMNWLVEKLVRGESAPVYIDNYVREFLYITDAIRALLWHCFDDELVGTVENIPGEPMKVHDYMNLAWDIAAAGSIEMVDVPDFHKRIGPRNHQTPFNEETWDRYPRRVDIPTGLLNLVRFYTDRPSSEDK